jgi:gamma-glutamylcyclotransferase (GGCT)/AIG2-like uncharacterized protein YtfP
MPSTGASRLDRLSGDGDTLFVYGTLVFPDVRRALLGRDPTATARTATGWRVAALRDRTYPGLVAGQRSVDGLVLPDLRPDEWQVIDAFEDDTYRLEPVRLAGGASAWVYVWDDPGAVLPDDWDQARFAACHLAEFARRIAAWRDQLTP